MKIAFTKANKSIFLMLTLFFSLTIITSCGDDDDGDTGSTDPSTVAASFTSQVDAANSMTYSFTNTSSVTGISNTAFESTWDFGGDGTSSEENPTHTFSAEGTYTVTLTVKASDGEEATSTEVIEVTEPKNKYAVITDTKDDDTGELRLELDVIGTGRVTFMYRVAQGPVNMDIADAFINVSGTSTTGDFAIMEVRLKDDREHEFREGADDNALNATFPEGKANVWVPIEVSWVANGTTTPSFTFIIDGETIVADAVSTTNGGAGDEPDHLAATLNGAANFQWKYADNSAINDGVYHVDDLVIYSSDSGMEEVVFSDDFQGRSVGYNLSSSVNAASPYHDKTSDATVGEE